MTRADQEAKVVEDLMLLQHENPARFDEMLQLLAQLVAESDAEGTLRDPRESCPA